MLDTREIVSRLHALESLAVIPRVASTNLIGRRVMNECIENELSLPQAMIIAGEQFAGRGRNDRRWSSAGKEIYATTLVSRPIHELPLIPLAIANLLATYLRETFAIDARIKWPNDILVPGHAAGETPRKIAGILLEARIQGDHVFLLIGTGINVEPVADDVRPNAVAISEVSPRGFTGIDTATVAFIEQMDDGLAHPFVHDEVLARWRALSLHRRGDRIHCVLGDRTIAGVWAGIDEEGRALVEGKEGITAVSAGDLVLG
jgi:BirA family transcriptional regulator, biotin operon repressor / biotin---[acetyl-CoA-carboxylase] ligase